MVTLIIIYYTRIATSHEYLTVPVMLYSYVESILYACEFQNKINVIYLAFKMKMLLKMI